MSKNKGVAQGGFFAQKKKDEDSLSFGELLLETEASGTREGEISKGIVLAIKDDQVLIDITSSARSTARSRSKSARRSRCSWSRSRTTGASAA